MEDDIIVSSQIPAVTTFSYDPSAITAFALVTCGGERYRYAYPAIHNLGWYRASCAIVFGRLAAAQTFAGTRRRSNQAGHPDNFGSAAARTYHYRHQPADDRAATNAVHGCSSKPALTSTAIIRLSGAASCGDQRRSKNPKGGQTAGAQGRGQASCPGERPRSTIWQPGNNGSADQVILRGYHFRATGEEFVQPELRHRRTVLAILIRT